MKRCVKFLMAVLVLAISVSCGKENTPGGGGSYGDLAIFWGEDQYVVEAGQSVPMAFTIIGTEGVAVQVKPSVDDKDYSVRMKLQPDYTGVVTLTAPDIVLKKKTVTVTLLVTDKHGREASMEVPVISNKSQPLQVAFAAEIQSVATQPGKTFEIPFVINGLASAEIVEKKATVSSGWTLSTTWPTADAPVGKLRVTAPAALTPTFNVTIKVKDDYDRSSELDVDLNVVEIATTKGAANCFIVKPGASVTIKGVKGNSTEELDFDNAGLVWQDCKGMVKSVAGNGDEKVVVVALNEGKSGNAVVCARKGATIVWSWHLWVSDFDPNEDPFSWSTTDTTGVTTTYTFMDRNLGAMSATQKDWKAFGLLYQWGRKDPFVGATGGLESAVPATMYDINGNTVEERLMDRPKTEGTNNNLQLSIENPDMFLYCSNTNLPCDWFASRAAGQNNELWGMTSGLKTIYDPCPEGWMVPAAGAPWKFRFHYSKQGALNNSLPYDETKPWYIDDDSVGFRYKKADGKEYWFPFPGKRDCKNGLLGGTGGGAQYHTRTCSQTFSRTETFAWGNPSTEFDLNRPYGSSVRCIKEN